MSAERRYGLDWVRALGMFLVFTFHVGMFLNPWPWHVKAEPTSSAATVFNQLFLPWGMPLFFVISGYSARLAGLGRTTAGFVSERLTRLGPPLLLGMFVLSPPQVWIERSTQGGFSGTFAAFVPHYFEGFYPAGNFAWMGLHLWYLLLLLVISIVTLPLLRRPLSDGGLWGRALARGDVTGVAAVPILVLALVSVLVEVSGLDFGQAGWPLWLYGLFYLMGLTLVPRPAFQRALQRTGPWLLLGAVITSIPVALLTEQPFQFTAREVLFQLNRIANSWLWISGLIWVGERYLNRGGPALRYVNEAVLPFYVLHQPVIIGFGYLWRTTPIAATAKFLLVETVSFAVIMAIYHLAVRPNGPIRFLMGMRPLRRTTPHRAA